MSEAVGRVFEIQRFSIHDGPGIRTTVFLQGCPLRCLWCHNPEGMPARPLLSFLERRCVGCGYCIDACPGGAHRIEGERHIVDRGLCEVCGLCTKECYAGALEISGREMTVGEVLATVLRDRPFYDCSGGGMTLSGGEPLAQPDFAKALLAAAKAEGMHCCVETCGFVDREDLLAVRSLVDLFLYDLKDTDDDYHRRATGVSNIRILKNLRVLHDAGAAIRLRVPVIPGYNARPDLFDSIVRLCAELPNIEGVELMPYHRLGESKVERFGLDPADRATGDPPEPTEVARWQRQLESGGVRVVR